MNVFPMNGSQLPPRNDLVLLDTNVILRLLGYDNKSFIKSQLELKKFITTLALNNNTLLYTVKTAEEISNVMENQFVNKLKSEHSSKPSKKFIIQNTPNFHNEVEEKVNDIWNKLRIFDHFYDIPIGNIDDGILTSAKRNSVDHKLSIGDAIIYTIAKQESIQNIISCDCDFAQINDAKMNLYLDSNNYTKHIKKR